MKVTMHAMSVELFANTLGNLSAILEKAAANAAQRKFDAGVLLAARLAPDMLPLTRQVQIAADIAKNTVARLARTIDFLSGVPASALEGSETREVKLPAGERTLQFTGLELLRRWAIPNVFFHVTTAYAILRHNGVDLGKRDFLNGGRDW